jgi:hypothetical protein
MQFRNAKKLNAGYEKRRGKMKKAIKWDASEYLATEENMV